MATFKKKPISPAAVAAAEAHAATAPIVGDPRSPRKCSPCFTTPLTFSPWQGSPTAENSPESAHLASCQSSPMSLKRLTETHASYCRH